MEDPQTYAYAAELLATWDEMDEASPTVRKAPKTAATAGADSWVSDGGVVVKGNRG